MAYPTYQTGNRIGASVLGAAIVLAIGFAGQGGALGWDGAIRFDEPQGTVIRLTGNQMDGFADALGRTWAHGLSGGEMIAADPQPAIDI